MDGMGYVVFFFPFSASKGHFFRFRFQNLVLVLPRGGKVFDDVKENPQQRRWWDGNLF